LDDLDIDDLIHNDHVKNLILILAVKKLEDRKKRKRSGSTVGRYSLDTEPTNTFDLW
jgi:stage III sporulation protein SpoIIIAA